MSARTPLRAPPKAVFLDFDGVVLESHDIKTEAFRVLFRRYRGKLREILNYHRRHAGVSRFVKFDHIHRRILRIPLNPAGRRSLGERFARFVEGRVLRCPFVPGALPFLRTAAVPLFVVSGTPQSELRGIVRRRRLARFFRGVFGSPPGKDRLCRQILKRRGWRPREVLFIGDGRSDWAAARVCGLRFLGRVPPGRRSPFPPGTPIVRNLRRLETRW